MHAPGSGTPDILVLSFTDHARDPRVNRQVRFLAGAFRVATAGTAPSGVPGTSFLPLPRRDPSAARRLAGAALLALGRFEAYYWSLPMVRAALAAIPLRPARLIVANDVETLPLALRLADGGPVLFDAHEYAPLEFEESLRWRLLHGPFRMHVCRRYIPRTAAMVTVGHAIAERYARETGVTPEVVYNACDFEPLAPSLPEPGRPLRLVHHGGAQRTRRLEGLIDTLHALGEGYELHFLLVPNDPAYLAELRARAAGDPRVVFHEPVPMRDLPRALNAFDVGVYLLPQTSFNNRNALPNKLFEFVQARLAVAIGPAPEMARLVREHGFGVVAEAETPQALALAIRSISRTRLAELKARADAAARALSADASLDVLVGLARRLLGRG